MKTNDLQQASCPMKRPVVIIIVLTAAACCAILWRQWATLSPLALVEALVGLCFMAALSLTDLHSQRIPNKLLLFMLCAWAVLQMVAVATGDSSIAYTNLVAALMGGGFSFFVFFVVYIATRRQLGGGDVKLAAIMGLYLTNLRVLGAILYGLIICALYSLIMIALKRLGKKDSVPLAPFLALGYALSFLFVF